MTIDFHTLQREVEHLSPENVTIVQTIVEYLLKKQRQSRPLKDMYDAFAPVREAVDQTGMSEAEINALIDKIIDDVRHDRLA